jgi:hypothetical protein
MAIDFRLVKFFVEGEGDQVFIRDILKIWYDLELTKEKLNSLIIICGGYDGINSNKNKIKDRDRDFTEKDKWIIDCGKNPFLKELKTFLDRHLLEYNR